MLGTRWLARLAAKQGCDLVVCRGIKGVIFSGKVAILGCNQGLRGQDAQVQFLKIESEKWVIDAFNYKKVL